MPGLFGGGGSAPPTVQETRNPNTAPFRGEINTPTFTFGGGKLTRKDDSILDRERKLADLFGIPEDQLFADVDRSQEVLREGAGEV